jgi:hypothetical protein
VAEKAESVEAELLTDDRLFQFDYSFCYRTDFSVERTLLHETGNEFVLYERSEGNCSL